jgi:hypothetical protein
LHWPPAVESKIEQVGVARVKQCQADINHNYGPEAMFPHQQDDWYYDEHARYAVQYGTHPTPP